MKSLAKALVSKKIRVNAVAPGPIWTPFITGQSYFDRMHYMLLALVYAASAHIELISHLRVS